MQVGNKKKKQVNKRRLSSGREMSGRIYNLRKTSHKIRGEHTKLATYTMQMQLATYTKGN